MRLARVFWKIPRYTTSTDQDCDWVAGAGAELPSAVDSTIKTCAPCWMVGPILLKWYARGSCPCQGGRPLGLVPCPRGGVSEYEHILSSADGPVGVVTLNRPKQLNALAGPVMEELVDALEQHEADAAIRAMVVTGGPSVFAAGADLKGMADASPVDMLLKNRIGLWDRARGLTK